MTNTSWRTTASGVVTSAAGLIIALSSAGVVMPRGLVVAASFVMAGGFAMIGITGKDAAVHSTVSEVAMSTAAASTSASGTRTSVSTIAETESTPPDHEPNVPFKKGA